jgi:hypothetical protein
MYCGLLGCDESYIHSYIHTFGLSASDSPETDTDMKDIVDARLEDPHGLRSDAAAKMLWMGRLNSVAPLELIEIPCGIDLIEGGCVGTYPSVSDLSSRC